MQLCSSSFSTLGKSRIPVISCFDTWVQYHRYSAPLIKVGRWDHLLTFYSWILSWIPSWISYVLSLQLEHDASLQVWKSAVPVYLWFSETFMSDLFLSALPCFKMWGVRFSWGMSIVIALLLFFFMTLLSCRLIFYTALTVLKMCHQERHELKRISMKYEYKKWKYIHLNTKTSTFVDVVNVLNAQFVTSFSLQELQPSTAQHKFQVQKIHQS